MSRAAPGSIVVIPDMPVARYSPEMEACYEGLHEAVFRGLTVPDSVDAITELVIQLRRHYYRMRDHFEADDGVSSATVDALPEIDITQLLIMLTSWETDHKIGLREYEQRDRQTTCEPVYFDPIDRLNQHDICWRRYRLWMFEANRALTICRKRIFAKAPAMPARQYEWLKQNVE